MHLNLQLILRQRQRLAIARALLLNPSLLVLDEPSVGLHPRDIERLIAIIRTLTDAGNALLGTVNLTGGISTSQFEDNVRQSIFIILGTAPGERVMRPDYGCGIHDLVFEPNTPTLRGTVQALVRKSLVQWEPRIDVLDVRVDHLGEVRLARGVAVRAGLRELHQRGQDRLGHVDAVLGERLLAEAPELEERERQAPPCT